MQNQLTNRPTRQRVSLRKITTRTDVFQFRHVEVDPHHVASLAAVLTNGNSLDPLTLWADPDTGELVVVDGHHRLAAYKKVGWPKKIVAAVYTCGIEQARLLALKENGKTRLALTKDERMDAAWALVCLLGYSKRVIRETTGVADGTIATMRKTRASLLQRDPDDELPEHWWQALALLKERERREYTQEERDAMIEAKTAQLDDKIGTALGFMAMHQPEAAVAVVAKRLGKQGLRLLWDIHGDEFDPYGLNEDGVACEV